MPRPPTLPSLEEIDTALAERSLHKFVQQAWTWVEPEAQAFVDNWHIQAVCEHLEAVTAGQIRNLIINIPPRSSKSTIVSVMWPAWEWGPARRPGTRWLCSSYSAHLARRDSMKCRKLIESRWYRDRWGSVYSLAGDQNAKDYYENTKSGRRVATSIGGGNTGEGGDRLVIDDPHEAGESKSDVRLEDAIEWYRTSMSTRANNPKSGSLCLIGQRVHHADLTAYILDTLGDKFDKLILPAEYESPSRCTSSIGFVDPRITEGELLWPKRFDTEYLQQQRLIMGSANYTAQYQQRPTAVSGSVFKREWFATRYTESPRDVAARCHRIIQSWDCAFKDAETSSYVVGQVWGVSGVDRYLLAERREHLDFVRTKAAIRAMAESWPTADLILIEDKANGPAIINDLNRTISGIVPVQVEGSKEARAQAVTPECESGNVILPSAEIAPWIEDYIEELCQFPRGRYNDRVDATSQALSRLKTMLRESTVSKIHVFGKQSAWNTSQWGMR